MRIGMLTGGDCPGLNAVIRAVVRKGIQYYAIAKTRTVGEDLLAVVKGLQPTP